MIKTLKRKVKLIQLPYKCLCGSKRGKIEIDDEDGYKLYLLKCNCGFELDHSLHKELLGKKNE